jgi:hypothetical protein
MGHERGTFKVNSASIARAVKKMGRVMAGWPPAKASNGPNFVQEI